MFEAVLRPKTWMSSGYSQNEPGAASGTPTWAPTAWISGIAAVTSLVPILKQAPPWNAAPQVVL